MNNGGAHVYPEIVEVVKDLLVWPEEVPKGLELLTDLSSLVISLKLS